MNGNERRLPEHINAAIELETIRREAELLQQFGLYKAMTERLQWFSQQGIDVSYRREVTTLFKTVVQQRLKREGVLEHSDFVDASRMYYPASPSISLILERPQGPAVSDIRRDRPIKQDVLAYVVTAQSSGSLLFAQENRIRYRNPNARVVLPSVRELERLRPYEIKESSVLEGLSKLFYESPFPFFE